MLLLHLDKKIQCRYAVFIFVARNELAKKPIKRFQYNIDVILLIFYIKRVLTIPFLLKLTLRY
jgi:hypothetical protein